MFRGTVRPLAVFCGGALCAFLLCLLFSLPTFIFFCISFLLFLLFILLKYKPEITKTIAVLFLGISFGFLWQGTYDRCFVNQAQSLAGQNRKIEFTVTEVNQYGFRGYTEIASVRQKLYLKNYQDISAYTGDKIICEVTFSLPSYRGGFDGERYYASDGIFLLVTPADVDNIIVEKGSSPFYTKLGVFRQWVNAKADSLFGSQYASIKALLLGDKAALTDNQSDSLSSTGLSHAFVVSGMHLSFLSGVLQFLTILNPYMIIPVLMLIAFYAVLTGFGFSVIRAFLMLIYDRLGEFFELQPDPLTSLSLSLLIILLPNPYALMNPGLIFSYLAVSGILFLKPRIVEAFYFPLLLHSPYNKQTIRIRSFFSSFATSLSAGIATLPAVGYFTGSVSLIFLPANLLLLFPVSFCFYAGLVSLCVFLIFPPLGQLLSLLPKFFLSLFWDANQILSSVSYAEIGISFDALYIYLFAAVILLFLLSFFRKHFFHPLPVGLLICGYLIVSIYGSVLDYRTDFSLYCPSTDQPCVLISAANVNILLGYDEDILTALQKRNIEKVDYFIPLSLKSGFPPSALYRNKIQEPCTIVLDPIDITYSYSGNVTIHYLERNYSFLSTASYPVDSDILFITKNIVSDDRMQILLSEQEAILLGKPSSISDNQIILSNIPYYDGDLTFLFRDGESIIR